jgi:hypothetical protein
MAQRSAAERAPGTGGRSPAARVGAGVVMAVVLAAGVLVLGRLAATSTVAMVLTTAWFAAVLAVAWLLLRHRRHLWLPAAAGYVLVGLVTAVLIGLPTLVDKEVDEQVVTGAPAAQAPPSGAQPDAPAGGTGQAPRGNVELARGTFTGVAHRGAGRAAVVELAAGGRRLTLTGFSTDRGPDLRVYLTARDPARGGEIGEFVDLGALKGNRGDQQYELPDDADLERYGTVVIWCRAFAVPFTSAPLGT